jgi:hypothetical protein
VKTTNTTTKDKTKKKKSRKLNILNGASRARLLMTYHDPLSLHPHSG